MRGHDSRGDIMEYVGEILKILVTAGLSTWGAFLIYSKSSKREAEVREGERLRAARYVAMQVVSALDNFIMTAFSCVLDEGVSDGRGELQPETTDPTLTLPDDANWLTLEPDLMYKILSLPSEIAYAREGVAFFRDPMFRETEEEYFAQRKEQFGRVGLKAYDLAEEIRQSYAIPPRAYGVDDIREILEREPIRYREKLREPQVEWPAPNPLPSTPPRPHS